MPSTVDIARDCYNEASQVIKNKVVNNPLNNPIQNVIYSILVLLLSIFFMNDENKKSMGFPVVGTFLFIVYNLMAYFKLQHRFNQANSIFTAIQNTNLEDIKNKYKNEDDAYALLTLMTNNAFTENNAHNCVSIAILCSFVLYKKRFSGKMVWYDIQREEGTRRHRFLVVTTEEGEYVLDPWSKVFDKKEKIFQQHRFYHLQRGEFFNTTEIKQSILYEALQRLPQSPTPAAVHRCQS